MYSHIAQHSIANEMKTELFADVMVLSIPTLKCFIMRVWVCMCLFFLSTCCYFSCAVHIFLFQSNSSLSVRSYQQEPADTIMYIGHAFAFVCTVCTLYVLLYMNRWWVRVGEIKRKLSIGPINNGIFSLSTAMTVCVRGRSVHVHMLRECIGRCYLYRSIHPNKWTWCHANLVSCTMHAFNADMIYYISVIQIYER